jgi:UrcA family protein
MTFLGKTVAHTAIALGLASAAISPAMAGEPQLMTINVSTSDINLGTVQGQKLLDQRVEKAVRTVCRVNSVTTGSRLMSHEVRACLAKARTSAKQQVAALMSNKQRGV